MHSKIDARRREVYAQRREDLGQMICVLSQKIECLGGESKHNLLNKTATSLSEIAAALLSDRLSESEKDAVVAILINKLKHLETLATALSGAAKLELNPTEVFDRS